MAITSAICTSFKVELLKGVHNFTATTGNTFKIALYDSDATLGAGTTAFTTSEEITNTSGSAYTSGGATLTSVTPVASSTTAICDFSDVSFSSARFPHSLSFYAFAPQPVARTASRFQYAWPQVNRPHPEETDIVVLLC